MVALRGVRAVIVVKGGRIMDLLAKVALARAS
jgi:hypothetical protein